jgi:choline dehydrogenase
VPYNEDYNGPSQEGVGYMQLTQHRGIRCSAADAFLTPLRRKTNFTVCLKAFVERVEFEGKRAVAVVYRRNGKTHRAAGRGIVLSAGAINSPKLLMLSGIGSEAELSHHGIQTLVNLPGVGRNLREHPFISITCRSKVATNNLTQGMIQKLSIGAKFAFRREGPIANAYEAMAFLKLDPNAAIPEFQIFFAPIAWERIGQQLQLTPYPGFQVTIVRSHSVSNGHVRLSSKDPVAPPVIELALLDSDSDVDALASGISAVRNILGTGPIAELLAEEISPGTLIRSARALKDHIRTRAGTACHPMGTCRMGLGKDAVVDPDLKVHGTDNLWVADASIMPDQISANHNAPCMMIGAKLGKQLSRMI